jgi:hypothetical protein
LVRGEYLPRAPSAACAAAVFPSKSPPFTPPPLEADGHLSP